MKALLITLALLAFSAVHAEPLKLFTDVEYKELLKGDVTFTDSFHGRLYAEDAEGATFEAVVGLKQKITPWLQISGGVGYDMEKQEISGQTTETELTYVFLKVQTVIVLIK